VASAAARPGSEDPCPVGGRPGLATLIRGGVQGSVSADHQDSWGAMSDVDYPIDPFDFSTPDDAYKVVAIEFLETGRHGSGDRRAH
jgi:hypothetical protein